MSIELTEDECNGLTWGCEGAGEYLCTYRTTHRKTGKPVGGGMLGEVEKVLEARMADAWDEGYQHIPVDGIGVNPYRKD